MSNKYPEKCHVAGCPCGYFSSKLPSESPAIGKGDAGFLVSEPENTLQGDSVQSSPTAAPPRESTALRNTRSIVHHAEMVKNETAMRNLREALKDNDHALFSDAWDFAPLDIRRVTEQACAEFFYELGRRDERRLLTEIANDHLREMARVARERLRARG